MPVSALSAFCTVSIQLNVDALAGITIPSGASAPDSIDTPMNAEALAGFARPFSKAVPMNLSGQTVCWDMKM